MAQDAREEKEKWNVAKCEHWSSEALQRALELVRKKYPEVGPDDEEVQQLVAHFKRKKK